MFRFITTLLTVFAATCTAKVALPNAKIIGGSYADIKDFPHQVAVFYKESNRCSGSVYSENIIITAAHCVHYIDIPKLSIIAGSSLLSERKIEIPVKGVIQHPMFGSFFYDYDVALLFLSEPLQFEAAIQPITLAKERVEEGATVTITGWGTLEENGYISNQLQKVDLNVVSTDDCKRIYSSYYTERMLCAAVSGGGRDACQYDAGGPLIFNNQLLGILSWGAGCGRDGYPGVYSSIPDLFDWIEENALKNAF